MNYLEVHKKWREYWAKNDTNKFDATKGKPYYALEMFPYPSGANLHLGHFFAFAPADTHARFKRMMGVNVFHPMGFDAFGLPAENHALKTDTHPHDNTLKNMEKFREQLGELGGMYDWEYTLTTCFPDYYKWTQWLFLELFKVGLAYQKDSSVNWCGACATVLANEQVVGGECERCSNTVKKRVMKQWFFKITEFAEELLSGLDKIDWPEKTKTMQRNWIGKSEGRLIKFDDIEVFTTRVDTIHSVTFMALAPEHPLIQKNQKPEVKKYVEQASKKSEVERMEHAKTGVFTGEYVVNPANKQKVPVYVADYVLMHYGTGAVMGVPGYDERDREFATKLGIEIKENPLDSTARFGVAKTTYRLRDWSISRQRYWGAPIPIIYCGCSQEPIPAEIPVILPRLKDFKPRGDAPLANDSDFVNTTCPKCGGAARREVETMDTFVCSAWYFLRYPYAMCEDVPFRKEVQPVDVYVGGAEHSCGHLLYARFITKVLKKLGHINFDEPFKRLIHQGMILGDDGTKISKRHNATSPDEIIARYGSDILRLYMLFGFNFVDGGPWNEGTMKTIPRFVERIERVISKININKEADENIQYVSANTIKSVREDLENFSFNTAVARCMEFVNALTSAEAVSRESARDLVLLIAPLMPHIAEELWQELDERPSVFDQKYPDFDPKYLKKDTVEIAVQVNSKIVKRIVVKTNATESEVIKQSGIEDYKKVVYIPGRVLNFITGGN